MNFGHSTSAEPSPSRLLGSPDAAMLLQKRPIRRANAASVVLYLP